MNLKEGDKYYCIKNLKIKFEKNKPLIDLFVQHNYYEVTYINKYECVMKSKTLDDYNFRRHFKFTLVKGGKYCFSDYFADIKKLRKEKIKKLYEKG